MKLFPLFQLLIACAFLQSCSKKLIEYNAGDICIQICEGANWLHDYPLLLDIKKKNPPQIAVWVEDTDGTYVTTLFATKKIATQGWSGSDGNRRKEALPHWCHSRGICYEDGLYCPTRERPLTDGITGASPLAGFDLKCVEKRGLTHFIVKVEVNHSKDFNDTYPKDVVEGDPRYSGESGQPALVYKADVNLASGQKTFTATLIGHSSPDGSDGTVYADMTGITTALDIVKQITVIVK